MFNTDAHRLPECWSRSSRSMSEKTPEESEGYALPALNRQESVPFNSVISVNSEQFCHFSSLSSVPFPADSPLFRAKPCRKCKTDGKVKKVKKRRFPAGLMGRREEITVFSRKKIAEKSRNDGKLMSRTPLKPAGK